MKRQEIDEKIVKKAILDPKFKESLMKDPKGAVKGAAGAPLPGGITLKVLEETKDKIYLVLPFVQKSGEELSDDALEAVAGGGPYKVESLKYDNKGVCV